MSYNRCMGDHRVSKQRLSERIADDLQRSIVEEGLIPNRRLSTEAELVEHYGVSRQVIREAARILVQRGLVTVAPGRGMLVADFDGAQIAEQFSLLMLASNGTFEQLLDLRLAVEVQVATSAAREASQQDIDVMTRLIEDGRQLVESEGELDTEAFLESDLGFHEALAHACGNPFFQLVCHPINSFLRSHYSHREQYPSSPTDTLSEHTEILRALADGDTFFAHQAMHEHLRRLRRKAPRMPEPTANSPLTSNTRGDGTAHRRS